MQIPLRLGFGSRRISKDKSVTARARDPQRARAHTRCSRQSRRARFAAVDSKGGCVRGTAVPGSRVSALALCERSRRESIFPATSIPVIDVKRQGDEIFPKAWLCPKFAKPFLGGRATATSFRSVKFYEVCLFVGALKERFFAGDCKCWVSRGNCDYD